MALPKVVENSVESCDALYIEIPADDLNAAAARLMLPDGKTLKEVLPEQLYQRTSKYLASKGMPMAALERFKVWALAVQIPLLDYLPQMMQRQPLDMMLYSRAKSAGKEVGGIETVDEQLDVFDGFSEEEQIRLLADALDHMEKEAEREKSYYEQLVEIYLGGDQDQMLEEMKEELDEDDPLDAKFFKRVLTDRNLLMAERIAAKIRGNPSRSYFFAIGSAHLAGEEGVLQLLKAQGLRLSRLAPEGD